jgi:hypothetical protein
MCMECPVSPPPGDMNGNPICEFCHNSIPNLGANLAAHYLQCQAAQQASTTYGRKDRLIAHLRSHPGIVNASQIAAAGRYTINSKWPRQCGFCGVFFKTFDERMDHIGSHFQAGLDMASWRLPFILPKEFRPPGFKPHSKGDDNDSDEDMDDNDSRPSSQRTGSQQQSSSTGSSQKSYSNGNQKRGSSSQGGHKRRHQVSQADCDNCAAPGRNNVQGHAKTSVALERYLNDVEEPIEIRLSLGSKTAEADLTRDNFSNDVEASLQVEDQQMKRPSRSSQGSQPLEIGTTSQEPMQAFQQTSPISSSKLAYPTYPMPITPERPLEKTEHYEGLSIQEVSPTRQAGPIKKKTDTASTFPAPPPLLSTEERIEWGLRGLLTAQYRLIELIQRAMNPPEQWLIDVDAILPFRNVEGLEAGTVQPHPPSFAMDSDEISQHLIRVPVAGVQEEVHRRRTAASLPNVGGGRLVIALDYGPTYTGMGPPLVCYFY